jgi:short-subunit dehydrogenase
MKLKGKILVITGASSGIGAATARAAAREGARVLLLARSKGKLDDLAEEMRREGGQVCAYPVDLTDAQAVAEVATRITREVGTPDILVKTAGFGRWLSTEETSPEEAVSMMAAPYFATFFLTRALLPDMLRRNSGTIVNMTSLASRIVWPGAVAYTAARWAMRGFTKALRADLNGTGVRTMLVTFAAVSSSYWEHNPGSEERIPKAQAMIPVLSPEQAAVYLLRRIKRRQHEVMAPLMVRIVVGLNSLFPYITCRLMTMTGYRRLRATVKAVA